MSADSPVAILYGSDGYERSTLAHPLRIDPVGTTTQPVQIDGYTGVFPVQITNNLLKERLDGYSIGPLPVMVVSPNRTKTSVDGYSVTYVPVKLVSPNRLGTSVDGYSITAMPVKLVSPNRVGVSIDGYSIGPLPVRISGGSITTSNPSVGTEGDAHPASDTQIGGHCTGSWFPEPSSTFFDGPRDTLQPAKITADGSLQTWSAVLTDVGSFRDDFASALSDNLTGTVTFTNGSTVVTGSGTAFTTELNRFHYIKLNGHSESAWAAIGHVVDDTTVVLLSTYAGADGSGTANHTKWKTVTGSGGSISSSSSVLSISSGTTNGQSTYVAHGGDYGPLTMSFRFNLSQRIANQTAYIGFYDDPVSPTQCAAIEMSGTNSAQVTFITRSGSTASDLQSTTVTLPNGVTTGSYIDLVIEFRPTGCLLYYDPANGSAATLLGTHAVHFPDPYYALEVLAGITNTGVPAGSTTLSIDTATVADYNLVNISTTAQPLRTVPNPAPNYVVTSSITALNGTVAAASEGFRSAAIVLAGTWTATLVFEVSSDGGTTWTTTSFAAIAGSYSLPIPLTLSSVSSNGAYRGWGVSATTHVRVRASAFTSGTIDVRLVLSDSAPHQFMTNASIIQNAIASSLNSSTANLAAGASFTGAAESTLGSNAIQVSSASDQLISVSIEQSVDGTHWDAYDSWLVLSGLGDSRTFQATGSYFRLVATNIGGQTTSYFRLQTVLCPIVETLPRALTKEGKLATAISSLSYFPDPTNFIDRHSNSSLLLDVDGNMKSRAVVLTDEQSFRDDFTAGDPYTDLTGTVYFTNGSDIITGSGTSFLTELSTHKYLKLSSHDDSVYAQVMEVFSDTEAQLAWAYEGASDNGTGRSSFWVYNVETGASITQTGSEILLASGTTNGSNCQAVHYGDYLPYVLTMRARITQRITGQEAHFGFADDNYGSAQNQALVIFSGTANTQCTLRTSFSSSDIETTSVTLPNSAVTSSSNVYQLEVLPNRVCLFINDIKVAEHKLHIPGPYSPMDLHMCLKNYGTPSSTTTLGVDTCFFSNQDRLQVAAEPKGDPLPVKEVRAATPTSSNVTAAAASTLLLSANVNRLGGTVYNDSVATLYLKLGTSASTTSFTIALNRYDYYELPYGYIGVVYGYWSAATGTARVTEFTG